MSPDIEERLEKRLWRLHSRLRLGIEADHEAQIFGQGINYFHIEKFTSVPFSNSFLPDADRPLRAGAEECHSDQTAAS